MRPLPHHSQRWSLEINKAHAHNLVPGHGCHHCKGHGAHNLPSPHQPSVSPPPTPSFSHTHTHTHTLRADEESGWYGDHQLICLFIRQCLPLTRGGVCLKNVPRLGEWICMMNLEFIYLFLCPQPVPRHHPHFFKTDLHYAPGSRGLPFN